MCMLSSILGPSEARGLGPRTGSYSKPFSQLAPVLLPTVGRAHQQGTAVSDPVLVGVSRS